MAVGARPGSPAPVPKETGLTGEPREPPKRPLIDVLVATYESAGTLDQTLTAIRAHIPVHHLIVVDRSSRDGTPDIARAHGAQVLDERIGLGRARNLALAAADTDPVLFVDSDVVIERPDFYGQAVREYARPRTAAVVGMSLGHRFRYGLPLGLTLVGRRWALAARIPDEAQGRETYYLQLAARRQQLYTRYVAEAMVHHGTYRAAPHWPEFQGAAIRRSSGWSPRELAYSAEVGTVDAPQQPEGPECALQPGVLPQTAARIFGPDAMVAPRSVPRPRGSGPDGP